MLTNIQLTSVHFFKVFIPCVRGLLPSSKITKCLATFVEWYFYASSPIQTDKTLVDQDALLSQFDSLKGPFVEASPSSLNFPKLHSLQHISESTRWFGTPDNADTEITEHQHRIEVKTPYRRTNKRNPLPQIVKFVERRTALENKLDSISTSDNNHKDTSSITESYRHLSGKIPEGVIHINDASKLFHICDLELATRTFFHDLESANRVNKKNLPRVSNPMVSSIN
jgi:hypothetical protein